MVIPQCNFAALYPKVSGEDSSACATYVSRLLSITPLDQQIETACAYSPCVKMIAALRTLPECYWMQSYTNKQISCDTSKPTDATPTTVSRTLLASTNYTSRAMSSKYTDPPVRYDTSSSSGSSKSKSAARKTNNNFFGSGSGSSSGSSSSGSSSKVLIYVIIGAVVLVIILIIILIFVCRSKKRSRQREVAHLNNNQRQVQQNNHYLAEEYQDPIILEDDSLRTNKRYYAPDAINSVSKKKLSSTMTIPTVNSSTATGSSRHSSSDMRASNVGMVSGNQLDLRDLSLWRIDPQDISFIKTLAQGAFGEVWLGQYMGKHVAIKKLLHHKKTVDQVQKFIQEIKLISKLDSPYIVQFIGVSWVRPSEMMFLTEFITNGDLRDNLGYATTISKSDYPLKFQIALDIAEGLVYLHSLQPKIIHRDLKSRNILLDSHMGAKLTDFGVSRENNDATMTHNIGTYRWMAPEVLSNNYYNELTDIFSFGVILTEIDTHDVPYSKLLNKNGLPYTDTIILSQVIKGGLIPELSPNCPEWFQELAVRCMKLDPAERPSAIESAYIIRTEMKK